MVEAAILRLHVCEAGVVVGVDVGQVNLGFMAQEVTAHVARKTPLLNEKLQPRYRCEICLTNKSDNTRRRRVAVPRVTQLSVTYKLQALVAEQLEALDGVAGLV